MLNLIRTFSDSYKYQFGVTPQSANLWNDFAKENLDSELEWIGQKGCKIQGNQKEW